jgi:hypothetical protein
MSRRWVWRVVGAFVVWALLVGLARTLDSRPDVLLVGLTIAAATAVLWLCVDALAETESPRWELLDDEPVRPPGQDTRQAALTRLISGHLDGRRPDDGLLHRQLVGLVDQRLMERYGVSWRVDPERARALLEPELVALAEESPPHPRMTRRQIDVLLHRIEGL